MKVQSDLALVDTFSNCDLANTMAAHRSDLAERKKSAENFPKKFRSEIISERNDVRSFRLLCCFSIKPALPIFLLRFLSINFFMCTATD